MRTIRPLVLVALAGLLGCGGSGNDHNPTPGPLTLTLSTPNSNDGAILFKVTGGTVDSVQSGPMVQTGSYVVNSGFTRVVVAGNIVDGVIAKIYVPDVSASANYSVTVEQAANRVSFAQQGLAGYSIAVTQ